MERWLVGGLLLFATLVALSLLGPFPAAERLIYIGYSLTVPVVFGLFVLGGVYFGLRHLLTA